tara:strand:+ start:16770 stop:18020 length:1251 start_codon:yes stop_codon:yes gene_type:complete
MIVEFVGYNKNHFKKFKETKNKFQKTVKFKEVEYRVFTKNIILHIGEFFFFFLIKFSNFLNFRYAFLHRALSSLITIYIQIFSKFINHKKGFLIIPDDRVIDFSLLINLYNAKQNKLNVVCIPFAYPANLPSSFRIRSKKYNISNKDFGSVTYKEDEKVFYSPSTFLALQNLNILPTCPWIIGQGISDYVLLEEEAYLNSIKEDAKTLNHNIELSKYLIYSEDWKILPKKPSEKLIMKLNKNLKNIVVALPQYYEHKIWNFSKQKHVISSLLKELNNLKANVLLSFHPKMNIENYKEFIPNNFHVIEEDISCYANFANIFISFYSSTAFNFNFFNKKIVTIDLVNFQNDSYNANLNNNHLINNIGDLKTLLEKILLEDEYEIYDSTLHSSLSITFQNLLKEKLAQEGKNNQAIFKA